MQIVIANEKAGFHSSVSMREHVEKQITVWAYLKTIQGLQSCYISKQNGHFSIYKDFQYCITLQFREAKYSRFYSTSQFAIT